MTSSPWCRTTFAEPARLSSPWLSPPAEVLVRSGRSAPADHLATVEGMDDRHCRRTSIHEAHVYVRQLSGAAETTWACPGVAHDHGAHCCPEHGTHTSPHKGCGLR
jgi:hypothetical protein